MKFSKINIPEPHPWRFPSKYPYFVLGNSPGKILSEEEINSIRLKRQNWILSPVAIELQMILTESIGKTILLQVENPEYYYDLKEDLPNPILAELQNVKREKILDADIEFDQLFLHISNPRFLNRQDRFKEHLSDNTIKKHQDAEVYHLNFNAVIELSIEQPTLWKWLFDSNR